MLPEKRKKQQSQSLSRARMLWHRDLAWTVGFPMQSLRRQVDREAIVWFRLEQFTIAGGGTPLVIDREVLRRSELSASKLRNQFRKAVKKLFDDPDDWFARYDRLMIALKASIHGDEAASVTADNWLTSVAGTWFHNATESLVAGHPMNDLLKAIRFAESFKRKPANDRSWSEKAIETFTAIYSDRYAESDVGTCGLSPREYEVGLLTRLARIVKHERQWDELGRLLTSSGIRFVHYPQPNHFISFYSDEGRGLVLTHQQSAAKTSERRIPTRKTIRSELIEILASAASAKPNVGQAIMKAVCAVGTPEAVDAFESVAMDLYAEETRLRGLVKQLRANDSVKALRSKAVAKPILDEVNARVVDENRCRIATSLADYIRRISTACETPTLLDRVGEFLRVTRAQFSDALDIVELLVGDRCSAPTMRQRDSQLIAIFDGMIRLAKQRQWGGQIANLVRPPKIQRRLYSIGSMFYAWLHRSSSQPRTFPSSSHETLEDLWRLLDQLMQRGIEVKFNPVYDTIPETIVAGLPVDDAAKLIEVMCREKDSREFDSDELAFAFGFVGRAEDLYPFLVATRTFPAPDETLTTLKPLSQFPLAKYLIRTRILQGRSKELSKLVRLLSCLDSDSRKKILSVEAVSDAEWIEKYPSELREGLELLTHVRIDAERVARDVLASDFVDQDKLQREHQHLTQRLDSSEISKELSEKLKRRCQSIENQIAEPQPLSRGRLSNLNRRVWDRAALEYEQRVIADSTQRFCEKLKIQDVRGASEILENDPDWAIAASAIGNLEGKLRHWGLELLRCGLSGIRFDELSFTVNQEFVNHLTTLGINVTPWVDRSRSLEFTNSSDCTITISFTLEPIDYLLMGHHFGTCLSPGDINFFSAVSNAIDINKQVLYGRDNEGNPVGRCLVVLNATGQIIRYRAYAHSQRDEFDQAVENFIDELAREMSTTRTGTSASMEIPNLLSTQWYDDGPIPVEGEIALRPEDELRERFRTLAGVTEPSKEHYEELSDWYTSAVSKLGIRDAIHLWAGAAPNWINEALINHLQQERRPADVLLLAAELMAVTFDKTALAEQIIQSIDERQLIRAFRRSVCWSDKCFAFHFSEVGLTPQSPEQLFAILDPSRGLRLLRASRKKFILVDLDETDETRRQLLASCHQRLGRVKLADQLRGKPRVAN